MTRLDRRAVLVGLAAMIGAAVVLGVWHASPNDRAVAQTPCVTADQTLLDQVEPKTKDPWNGGRPDLLEMFTRSYETMQGNDTYTVADLKSRADKQGVKWQGEGPNPLWQAVYAELERLEACRDALPDPQPVDKVQTQSPPAVTPTVSIAAGSTVAEGANALFTVTANPTPSAEIMVSVQVYATNGAATSGSHSVTVGTSGSAALSIPTIDDKLQKSGLTITAVLFPGNSYDVGTTRVAQVTVTDNDDPLSVVTISGGAAIVEGEEATFTIVADPKPTLTLNVSVAVSHVGRVIVLTTQAVAVDTSGTATFTVATTVDDQYWEDSEVRARLMGSTEYLLNAQTTAVVQVTKQLVVARATLDTVCTADCDYDIDDDGLIDVRNLAQLNAIRWDTDGNGEPDTYAPSRNRHLPAITWTDQERIDGYVAAFPNAVDGMGCPESACKGYELKQHLNFDTNGDGRVDQAGDDYWSNGKGWYPLAGVVLRHDYQYDCVSVPYYDGHLRSSYDFICGELYPKWPYPFGAVFEGNGYEIRNLFVNDFSLFGSGLFGHANSSAKIRNLALTVTAGSGSVVRGHRYVGAIVGHSRGAVSAVRSEVDVEGRNVVGGLVGLIGRSHGSVIESYVTGNVTGLRGYSNWEVGGLAGMINASTGYVSASFATGTVSSNWDDAGGLVGEKVDGFIRATYATGDVNHINENGLTGKTRSGGLIGRLIWTSWVENVASSYSTGKVGIDGRAGTYSGLIGDCGGNWGKYVHRAYWDTTTSGLSNSACGTGLTTIQLQAPTNYESAQAISGKPVRFTDHWNVDVDNDWRVDDPWDFGTASQYPILKYCADKGDIENTAVLKTYSDKTGQEFCPLREVLQHGRALSP